MKLIDNVNDLLGDHLKKAVQPGARLKIAASCFSIYAFEALRRELESVESFEFIFTSPSFMPDEVTDAAKKERREFHIPKPSIGAHNERNFFGTEFEVQLKNKLTQRAIARECADWMRRKAHFRSNSSGAPMQQFAAVQTPTQATEPNSVFMPLHGFTAVDLGYTKTKPEYWSDACQAQRKRLIVRLKTRRSCWHISIASTRIRHLRMPKS